MSGVQVWTFADGVAHSVLQEYHGCFDADKAYVVLAPGESDQQKLYLWAGTDAPKETLATAAKHASDLKQTMSASYLRQQQGSEAAEFLQLFPKFEVKVGAKEVTDGAAPARPSSPEEDGEEEGEAEEGPEEEGGQEATPTGGKKKKRRNKKKRNQPAEGPASPAALSPRPEAPPSPNSDKPAPQPAATDKPAEPAAVADPESPAPITMAAVDKPAQPAATAPPPAAAKAVTPAPAANAATSATVAATVEPAVKLESASPKAQGSVEEPEVQGVSKAKEQLLSRLGSNPEDALGQRQLRKEGSGKGTNFQAESAKAWGGVTGVAAAPAAADVKIKPGEQTFGYEELKGMRVDSGIDMTCKEAYLTEAEFEKVFGKDRAAFKAMPAWRQQLAKKQVNLW